MLSNLFPDSPDRIAHVSTAPFASSISSEYHLNALPRGPPRPLAPSGRLARERTALELMPGSALPGRTSGSRRIELRGHWALVRVRGADEHETHERHRPARLAGGDGTNP